MKAIVIMDAEGDPCMVIPIPEGWNKAQLMQWVRATATPDLNSDLWDGDFEELDVTTVPDEAVRPKLHALAQLVINDVNDAFVQCHDSIDLAEQESRRIDQTGDVLEHILAGDRHARAFEVAVLEHVANSGGVGKDAVTDAQEGVIDEFRGLCV